ncbi:MAG TPA: hypothetical protein VJ044_18250, partial [Candidatus Hodarchaeales archaeon]|nr:hypothetical protein [Candidatus Hodarchaeales archaeon]
MVIKRVINLSATNIARLLDLNCTRRVVFDTIDKKDLKSLGINTNHPNFTQNIANRLLFEGGREFEGKMYSRIREEEKTCQILFKLQESTEAHYGQIHANEISEILNSTLDRNQLVLQAQIPISRTFLDRYVPKALHSIVSHGNAILDLLYIDSKTKTVFISDIKKSLEATNRHRFQVAFYWMVVDAWLTDIGLAGTFTSSSHGSLMLENKDLPVPGEPFDVRPYVAKVKSFLAETLAPAIALPHSQNDWHIVYSCQKCDYYLHCEKECWDRATISLIPFLTKTAKNFLNETGVITVDDLLEKFKRDPEFSNDCVSISREYELVKARTEIVQTTLKGNEPQWRFFRTPCPEMPNPRFVKFPIFVSSEKENIHGFTYQISLIYYDRDITLPISKSEDVERLTDHEGNPSGYFFKSWIMARPENSEQV